MSSLILRYFAYKHLPGNLQEISGPLHDQAVAFDELLPDGAEKQAGLRKLLEAKDCFVRAALPAGGGQMHCLRNMPETCPCPYCADWRQDRTQPLEPLDVPRASDDQVSRS